jgi:hypothetical protein
VGKAKSPVIRLETSALRMCPDPDSESLALMAPALADYQRQNEKKRLLQRKFHIDKPYELLSEKQLARFDSSAIGNSWKAFYARYPNSGGLIELSAVGFNAGKTVALVRMDHECGLLCGSIQFYVLKKTAGRWRHMWPFCVLQF